MSYYYYYFYYIFYVIIIIIIIIIYNVILLSYYYYYFYYIFYVFFYSRIYTALGRLLSGLDQIQGLVCELILKSQQLGLVESVASVWPYSLSRATGSSSPPLFVNNRLQSKGWYKNDVFR